MEAALAWYRARGAIRGPLGPIRVPTLYIWGDADDTVGRAAAEGTVFHRSALSVRSAARRRALCCGSGGGTCLRINAGTSRGASGVEERNASQNVVVQQIGVLTTCRVNDILKSRNLRRASQRGIGVPLRLNIRKSAPRC
jgi:hypothetical protein